MVALPCLRGGPVKPGERLFAHANTGGAIALFYSGGSAKICFTLCLSTREELGKKSRSTLAANFQNEEKIVLAKRV